MANTDVLPQLLTIEQLAERLGVSIRHIRRLVAERRVPYLKVGSSDSTRPRSLPGLMMLATLTSGTGARLDLALSSSHRRLASRRLGASTRDPVSARRSERDPNVRARISASTHLVAPKWRYSEGHAKCPDQVRS